MANEVSSDAPTISTAMATEVSVMHLAIVFKDLAYSSQYSLHFVDKGTVFGACLRLFVLFWEACRAVG